MQQTSVDLDKIREVIKAEIDRASEAQLRILWILTKEVIK
jgi:hypothetical protein